MVKNVTIIREGNMNYFLFFVVLHPTLVNTLQPFHDINGLSKLEKKACLSIFCLLLIYALPVDKDLFRARTNYNLII